MILNFSSVSTNESVSTRQLMKESLKKGGWKKKRLSAKRVAHQLKPKEEKAPKTIEHLKKPSKSMETPSKPLAKVMEKPLENPLIHSKKNDKKPVISSLFSANPSIPTLPIQWPNASCDSSNGISSANSFEEMGLSFILLNHLKNKLHLENPTKIQQLAIPPLIQSSTDMIIQSQTGSGKTWSFLIPLVQRFILAEPHLPHLNRDLGTLAIILTPTRELAQQIYGNLTQLLNYPANSEHKHWMVPGILIGGDSRKSEKARLRKGVHILVCTPGRLLDHLETTKSFNVSACQWMVLDEADRLLELGFQETLNKIFDLLDKQKKESTLKPVPGWSSERQNILCSATIEGGVQELAARRLKNPIHISANDSKTSSDSMVIPKQLKQQCIIVPPKLRLVTLFAYLAKLDTQNVNESCRIIIFVSCCDSVDFYHSLLTNEKLSLLSMDIYKLHGSLPQEQRTKAISEFTHKQRAILICTDVAARGLDLPNMTQVIQYDPPTDVKDYVHRCGRTARIGLDGASLLFLLPSEVEYVGVLRRNFSFELSEIKMDNVLKDIVKNNKWTDAQQKANEHQQSFETAVTENSELSQLAKKAYQSHIRAYATHLKEMQSIFHLRRVHIGHLAKSFGLREAPTQIGKKTEKMTKRKNEQESSEQKMKKMAHEIMKRNCSEFGSGL